MNQQEIRALPSERKDIKYIHTLRSEQTIDGLVLRKLGLFGYMVFIACACGFMGFCIGLVIGLIK